LLNQFRQLTCFGGLLQVGRETVANGLLDVRVRAGSGERNCRNRSEALDVANTPNELQAVDVGHPQVRNDNIRPPALCNLQSGGGVSGRIDRVTNRFQLKA